MNDDVPSPNPRRTAVIVCLVVAWLVAVYTLPRPWGDALGWATLAVYSIWALAQKHPPRPRWGSHLDGNSSLFDDPMVKAETRLRKQVALSPKALLRASESPSEGLDLLRPAEAKNDHEPDHLLRLADMNATIDDTTR